RLTGSRSSSYAALISAIRRVAARAACTSPPVVSGWCSRASRRHAALIVAPLASTSTPRTSYWLRFGTRGLYRWPGRLRHLPPDELASLDSRPVVHSPVHMPSLRRTGLAAALAVAPVALAYRFAVIYRVRA